LGRSAEGGRRVNYDVVITGAGLAGLSLARQLLMYTDKTVLLLDRQENPPGKGQKVGESLVQLAGYYFSKTLDLEEHLLVNHYLKYNLRFHWKTSSDGHDYWDDTSSASIRSQSNLATFQLDRNILEAHLMEINAANPRFRFIGGAKNCRVEFSAVTRGVTGNESSGDHKILWDGGEATGHWVVDASGRPGIFRRGLSLSKKNGIRHGSTWCWVEGQLNPEKLTKYTHAQALIHRKRQKLGNFPFFLATNHFCGEGWWFWVIPLHGMTSLGLVYDHTAVRPEDVSTGKKMLEWICREWPIFANDLPNRKIVDEGRLLDYSYDAEQTINPARWAMTGEAGRFSDPLYSPGSDLIAIYNTLIVDAVQTDQDELESKCAFYEQIMRIMYQAYIPSYATSYNCLGDPETLTLKYTWELALYFGFYVIPFVNQMFTNRKFMQGYLRQFAFFGPVNRNLQKFLSDFFLWKKARGRITLGEPVNIDFYDMEPLRMSEKHFYEVGLTPEDAGDVLEMHVERMREFTRYVLAHVHAVVLGDKRVLLNRSFVKSLKLRETVFDPELMRAAYALHAGREGTYEWKLNPFTLEMFIEESAVRERETVER
jgi:flavin-dependent dehydrogenase